jgi:hypothetical protein
MNNFEDFFIEFQENKLKIKEQFSFGQEELIFERYFDLLCSAQSNYDFYKFLDNYYVNATNSAKNCIELGFDIENIKERNAREWILSVNECIIFFVGKFLERKGHKFNEHGYDQTTEKLIIMKIKDIEGEEWQILSLSLSRLWKKARCNVAHTAIGIGLNNKSPITHKDVLKFKDEYVEAHMNSLENIRKHYPKYDK